jgi:signal transduction histidine kinase
VAAPLVWTSVITIQVALNVLLGSAVSGLIGALIGVNVGNRKRYLEALLDRSRQLWSSANSTRDSPPPQNAPASRARCDIVSHSLTVIVALAEGATATDDRERSREATSLVASTARAALGEMRGMLGVLRDESAADVPLSPVDEDTIPAAVEAARAAGAPVRLAVTGRPTGSRPVRLALARVVQEGLTNVLRHAPGARSVEVDLVYAGDGVELDSERRCPGGIRHVGPPGYGLRGIRERVDHVGGSFHAGSDRPGWWRLDVRIPWN